MKIVFDEQEDVVNVSDIDNLYVVAKCDKNRPLELKETYQNSGKYVFVLLDICSTYDIYNGTGDMSKKEICTYLKDMFEIHAFKTWKEAYKWLIDNCK
jgi:hypothetical protein